MRALLKNIGHGHFKQYEVIVEPEGLSGVFANLTIRYGKIGGTQQQVIATIPASEAESRFEKLQSEKIKKGYELVELESSDGTSFIKPHSSELVSSGTVVEAPTIDVTDLQRQLEAQLSGISE